MRESTVTDKPQCRKDNAANNDCDANEFQRLGKLINEGMDLVGQIPIPLHIQVVVALMLAFRLLRDAGAIWPDNSCMSLVSYWKQSTGFSNATKRLWQQNETAPRPPTAIYRRSAGS